MNLNTDYGPCSKMGVVPFCVLAGAQHVGGGDQHDAGGVCGARRRCEGGGARCSLNNNLGTTTGHYM